MYRYSTYFVFVCCLPHFLCCALPFSLGFIGITTYLNIFDFEQNFSWYENLEIYVLTFNLILLVFFFISYRNVKKCECLEENECMMSEISKKKKVIITNIIVLFFFNFVNFSVFFLEGQIIE